MIRGGHALLIAAGLASTAVTAHAQPAPKPPNAVAKREASAHYKQGKAYFDAGAFDKAIGEFRAAYDIAPADPLLFNIARSYHLANQKADAATWYHKYLTAQPDGPLADEARQYLAEVDKAIADEAAAAALEQERVLREQQRQQLAADAEAHVRAAEAHVQQAKAFATAGAFADAAKEYVAAYEADANADHLFDAGEVARAGHDAEAARELYRRYVIAAPTGAHAEAARKAIADLTIELARLVHVEPRVDRVVAPQPPPTTLADDAPTVELGLSMLPGVKLRADHPMVLAYRAELAFHLGRRVHFGLFTEYGTIQATHACGTDLAGPTPSTPFDFGARNRFTKCQYVMPGLVLDIHVLPRRAIDPWIGLAPGFRFGFNDWTTYTGGMATATHGELFLGIVVGAHAGVDYHPTAAFAGWVVSGLVETEITVLGDEDTGKSGVHYVSLFGGLRSTVAF